MYRLFVTSFEHNFIIMNQTMDSILYEIKKKLSLINKVEDSSANEIKKIFSTFLIHSYKKNQKLGSSMEISLYFMLAV